MNPRYPVYIISRSRWHHARRLTNRALVKMRVPHFMVVEADQVEEYRAVVDHDYTTLLVLDPAYKDAYDTCDEFGTTRPTGSGPARNFVWDHAVASGAKRHWIMDDNIRAFYRRHKAIRRYVADGAILRAMEDFVDRYENVALAGPHYKMFVADGYKYAPIILNTRIYSCLLIRNDLPVRWRGRYNEDTILSLDLLKAGWCTIQFAAFMQDKMHTQAMSGGNTDELYKDGTKEKSEMLVREHPDVARITWRYNRIHHHVDYRPFRANRLRRRSDVVIPEGVNEYGMRLLPVASDARLYEEIP